MSVAPPGRIVRWTPQDPCPVCRGHDRLPRGQGVRCDGFLTSHGLALCHRVSGRAKPAATGRHWIHALDGKCRCGEEHAASTPEHSAVVIPIPKRRAAPKLWRIPKADIEMCHRYEHAGGLAFEVCRLWKHARSRYGGAKAFSRHRGEDGQWYFGQGRWTGRHDKPLYREAQSLEALRQGDTLYYTAGERDADTIWDAGLVSTCHADGETNFREVYARRLVEAMTSGDDHPDSDVASLSHSRIVIVADNDATGWEAARKIGRTILRRAPQLRDRIDIARPNRGDLTEQVRGAGGQF